MNSLKPNPTIPFERSKSLSEAFSLAKQLLRDLQLDISISTKGTKTKTAYCYLYQKGELVSMGSGKGIGREAIVGALYEALEHYFTELNFAQIESVNMSVSKLAKTPILLEEKAIELLTENYNEHIISCRKYKCLKTSDFLFYPVFLSFPSYLSKIDPLEDNDIQFYNLFRYSTNSGTAIGASFEEALIHAINELIERDGISLFLLNTFLAKNPEPVRIINQDSLPQYERDMLKLYQKSLSNNIIIIDLTTDLGIPTICAIFDEDRLGAQPCGFGTSFSKTHALKRALSELQQYMHISSNNVVYLDKNNEELNSYPELKKCALFKVHEALNRTKTIRVHWERIDFVPVGSTLQDYVNQLLQIMDEKGYQVFFSTNFQSSSGIHVIHVISPGLEKFKIIMSGNIVAPGKRAMNILLKSS